MLTMRTHRAIWLIWMLAVLALLMWVFSPIEVQGHDEPDEVAACQAIDDIGEFTFPIGDLPELLELCNEVDGTLVLIPNPGPDEMVRLMWEFGLYNPYWIIEELFFGDEESPAPEE